ncbi:hypothetical protein CCO03_10945 [Comamonas serinivorans]|uniref:Uncharacterized protein n=1 Tax=Comamonas serinivorans TaxID=1082851 RepID=A0A1Y0EP88_9BURK|nr:zf-TFIIB domain-containing protein [Comamonas serinivorans]ARU05139.1 hypothetical protein CCO03_10945 [Comamonas serinivorans]
MSSPHPTETALTCPSCKARQSPDAARWPRLHPHVLTNGLSCQLCEQCLGMLVDIAEYSTWVARQKPLHASADPETATALPELTDAAERVQSWQALALPSALPVALTTEGDEPELGEWADSLPAPLKPRSAGPAAPAGGAAGTATGDSLHALVCPSCQRLMLRYRVTEPDIGLDFCFACTLVWLDHGEWELLAQQGLHLKITHISTSYWQRSQQRQRLQAQREAHLRELLGDAAFDQAMAFQRWLAQQPEREAILRFLRSDPPLEA